MKPSNDEAIAYVTSIDEGRFDVEGREQILIKILIQIEKLFRLFVNILMTNSKKVDSFS